MTSDRGGRASFALIVVCAAILYLLVLDGQKIGFFHDDGIYIVTAKSMAEGAGYRIPSLPNEPAQTKYPPLYPAILAFIWGLYPQFPSNAIVLLLPSVLATVAYLIVVRRYLAAELYAGNAMATFAVALTAFNSRTVILASNALSEALFTLISIGALWACSVHLRQPSVRTAVSASLLIAAAILTRGAGVVLLPAIAVYVLMRGRLLRAVPLLASGGAVFLCWTVWAQVHKSPDPALTFYTSYFGVFQEQLGKLDLLGVGALFVGNAFMLVPVSIPMVALGMRYSTVSALSQNLVIPVVLVLLLLFVVTAFEFVRHARNKFHLTHVYLVSYLVFHVVWPYSSYDRFLMPLIPFIMLFLLGGLSRMTNQFTVDFRRPGPSLMLLIATGFWIYSNVTGNWNEAVQSRAVFSDRNREDAGINDWIERNTGSAEIVLSYPDPRYYLGNGRRGMAPELVVKRPEAGIQSVTNELIALHARYLIHNRAPQLGGYRPNLSIRDMDAIVSGRPDVFAPVFSSGQTTIYRIEQEAKP